jgi:hypothetical protein
VFAWAPRLLVPILNNSTVYNCHSKFLNLSFSHHSLKEEIFSSIMFFVPTRPVIYRQTPIVLQFWRSTSSIPKPIYNSIAFRTATLGLLVSIPAALWVQKSYKGVLQSVSPLSEFYDGSLEWKAKVVKPLSLTDAISWLRQNESSQKGPTSSGV